MAPAGASKPTSEAPASKTDVDAEDAFVAKEQALRRAAANRCVIVVAGPPGGGKSTFIRSSLLPRLHKAGRRAALLQHKFAQEFGLSWGSDEWDDAARPVAFASVFDFGSGCVCCSPRGDVERAVRGFLEEAGKAKVALDTLVLETTGVADVPLFEGVCRRAFGRRGAVVVVADGADPPAGLENISRAQRDLAQVVETYLKELEKDPLVYRAKVACRTFEGEPHTAVFGELSRPFGRGVSRKKLRHRNTPLGDFEIRDPSRLFVLLRNDAQATASSLEARLKNCAAPDGYGWMADEELDFRNGAASATHPKSGAARGLLPLLHGDNDGSCVPVHVGEDGAIYAKLSGPEVRPEPKMPEFRVFNWAGVTVDEDKDGPQPPGYDPFGRRGPGVEGRGKQCYDAYVAARDAGRDMMEAVADIEALGFGDELKRDGAPEPEPEPWKEPELELEDGAPQPTLEEICTAIEMARAAPRRRTPARHRPHAPGTRAEPGARAAEPARAEPAARAAGREGAREGQPAAPEGREQATLNNSHAHHGALLAELRRSLGAFEPAASRSDAKDLLRRALRDPRHRDHVVLVLDGRIFTSKAFAHVSKNAMHLRMLAAAIRRHEPLPNVLMLHDSASDGNCHRTKEGRTLATTVIAKKGGYGQCGVLVPNPYYGRGDTADEWAWFVSELKGRAAKIPLERKRPVAFWRGTLGNHKELCAGDVCTPQNCARDDGNYARFQAMALTVSRPDAFDVKCHKFHPRNASDCAAELPFTDEFRALARDPSPIFDLRWFEAKDYAGFKYLLNLPGETAGSYSRNLNHLWAWYYPALRHGATHAAVNASTAPGVVDFLEARPWAFVKLVAGAAAVQDELLSPAALSRYVRAVVDALRAHGRQHVHLDDENATAELFRKVDCHGLVETTVWPHRGSKDHWVDNRLRKIKSCDDLVEAVRNSNGRGKGGRAWGTRLPG
ncbi:hypothetical protein JL722_845 [Aureococcus anophagefferens]|nr:hypothetical protein JL722_845 [Aureococcus anophagefferens]